MVTTGHVADWIKVLNVAFTEEKERLCQLDGALGDGDLGVTMNNGFKAVVGQISQWESLTVAKAMSKIGMILANEASSTLGTLLASAFLKAGKIEADKENWTADDALKGCEAFIRAIEERGKAKLGDKTILDVLVPALKRYQECSGQGMPPAACVGAASATAKEALEGTKTMMAQKGRPAWYREKSLGHVDPGSAVGVILIDALKQVIAGK